MGCTAGVADRLDGRESRFGALERREFPVDHRRSGAFAAQLEPLENIPFQAFPVRIQAREVAVAGIRLRRQIEQVECPAGGGCKIRRNRRNDASGSSRNQENSFPVELHCRFACSRRLLLQSDGPALAIPVSDFHDTGIAQRFLDQQVGERAGFAARLEIDDFHRRIGLFAFEGFGKACHGASQRV